MRKFAILTVIFYIMALAFYHIVIAVNPPAPFSPDDNIQDPDCLPEDSNCYVTIPTPGPTIYSGDGTLAGNRVVDLDGNNISFDGASGGNILLRTNDGNITLELQDAGNSFIGDDSTGDWTFNGGDLTLSSLAGNGTGMVAVDNTGLLSWTATPTTAWNSIINPTGTQSLTFDDGELNAWTVSSNTETFHTITANSLTTGKVLAISSSSLTSGSLIDLAITGTGAVSNQKGLNISLSGANTAGGAITYGINVSNTHTGTINLNYGILATASGGSFGNQAIRGIASGGGHAYGVYGSASGSSNTIGVYGTSTAGKAISGEATGGGVGVYGESDSGIAGSFSSGSGAALVAISASNVPFIAVQSAGVTNNDVATTILVARETSGTAANGIGSAITFQIETDSSESISNELISKWTTAADATRTSEFSITGVNSGTTSTLFTLSGSGALKLNKYGVGDFTGTPAYNLQVDSSGNIIEGTAGSAIWNSISNPTGTQSLTFDDGELNAWTVSSNTETFHTITANSLTTGKILSISSSSLTSGSLIDLAVTGTVALSGQKGINVSLSGANAADSQATYGVYASNSHTGNNDIQNWGVYGTASNVDSPDTGAGVGAFGSGSTTGLYAQSGSGFGIYTNSGTGTAIWAVSSGAGAGVEATSSSGTALLTSQTPGLAANLSSNPATTNSIHEVVRISRTSTGTATNGIGGSLNFYNQASDGNILSSAGLASTWTDVTVGTRTGDLEFWTTNSASSTVKMTILGNGFTGIGDTTPDYRLDVETDVASSYVANFFNDGNNDNRWGIVIQGGADAPSAGKWIQFNDGDGGDVGTVSLVAAVLTLTTTSDERLKENIEDTTLGLNTLNDILVRDFSFKSDGTHAIRHGFIAQELAEVYPDAVLIPENPDEYWQVAYTQLTPLIVKSIQELDIKLQDISDFENEGNSFGNKLRAWLGNSTNGIKKLFVKDEVCIGETCVNEDQLKALLLNAGEDNSSNEVEDDTMDATDSTEDSTGSTGDIQIISGDETESDEPVPEEEIVPEETPVEPNIETPEAPTEPTI